jgi:hypothetical protein
MRESKQNANFRILGAVLLLTLLALASLVESSRPFDTDKKGGAIKAKYREKTMQALRNPNKDDNIYENAPVYQNIEEVSLNTPNENNNEQTEGK